MGKKDRKRRDRVRGVGAEGKGGRRREEEEGGERRWRERREREMS